MHTKLLHSPSDAVARASHAYLDNRGRYRPHPETVCSQIEAVCTSHLLLLAKQLGLLRDRRLWKTCGRPGEDQPERLTKPASDAAPQLHSWCRRSCLCTSNEEAHRHVQVESAARTGHPQGGPEGQPQQGAAPQRQGDRAPEGVAQPLGRAWIMTTCLVNAASGAKPKPEGDQATSIRGAAEGA
eukprot:355151-Chlamydomonas_euryale.AAC.2